MGEINFNSRGNKEIFQSSDFSSINDIIAYQNAVETAKATAVTGALTTGAIGSAVSGATGAIGATATGSQALATTAANTAVATGSQALAPVGNDILMQSIVQGANATGTAATAAGAGQGLTVLVPGTLGLADKALDGVAQLTTGVSEDEVRRMAAENGWDYDAINKERNRLQALNSTSGMGGAAASINQALGREKEKTEEDFKMPSQASEGSTDGDKVKLDPTKLEEYKTKVRNLIVVVSSSITTYIKALNDIAENYFSGKSINEIENHKQVTESVKKEVVESLDALLSFLLGYLTEVSELDSALAKEMESLDPIDFESISKPSDPASGNTESGTTPSTVPTPNEQPSTPTQQTPSTKGSSNGTEMTTSGGIKCSFDPATGTITTTSVSNGGPNEGQAVTRTYNVGSMTEKGYDPSNVKIYQNAEGSYVVQSGNVTTVVDHSTGSISEQYASLGVNGDPSAFAMGKLDAGTELREVHFTSPEGCGFGMQVRAPGETQWTNLDGDLPAGASYINCSGTNPAADSSCAGGNCATPSSPIPTTNMNTAPVNTATASTDNSWQATGTSGTGGWQSVDPAGLEYLQKNYKIKQCDSSQYN